MTDGYGILQPRVSVTMASAAGSLFARTYAGHTGVDPYTTAVSDVYQDLFGEGIFTGKGLYDVDAFMTALDGRVPENALLSHDLFEGLHARAALVTDVEVVDDYPSNVLTHAARQHRWVRGDWQILWWLFPWVPTRGGLERNRLPLISRWKILDNLRRSLVAPSLVALFVAGLDRPAGPARSCGRSIALATMSFAGHARGCSSSLGGPRTRPRPARVPARAGSRISAPTSPASRAADLPRVPGVGHAPRGRPDAGAPDDRARADAAVGDGGRGRAARAASRRRGFYRAMRASPTIAGSRCWSSLLAGRSGAAGRAADPAAVARSRRYIAFHLSKPAPSSRPEI